MNTEDTNHAAQLISELAVAATEPKQIGDAHFVITPPGFQKHDVTDAVEKSQDVPSRKRGIVALGNVESLLAYMKDQKAADVGYVYADPDSLTIVAVFNDAKGDFPGWRDHRAIFKAEHTPEFAKWLGRNGNQMTQIEFAEFIEDNMADLSGDEATTLLTVATTIQATTGINFSSARRLQDGQTQLTYNESTEATAGAAGDLKIPQKFTLGVRIFKNGDGYAIKCRLKYRLHSGAVKFFFEMERPQRAIEDAFKGYVAEVAEKSEYTVLIGKP